MRLWIAVQQQHRRPATPYNTRKADTMDFRIEPPEAGKKR
jgi:hypothetical protein